MITIAPTSDLDLILSILNDKSISERVDSEIKLSANDAYLSIRYFDEFIGVITLQQTSNIALKMHIAIIKEYRKHRFSVIKEFYQWCLLTLPSKWQKLSAEIPTLYKEIYVFSKLNGFRDEGLIRSSVEINKMIFDSYMVGITKSEIKVFLGGK